MKTIMMKIAFILAIMLSVNVQADDHLFTLPVVGNDIYVNHAWFYADGTMHRAIDYTSSSGAGVINGREIIAAYGGIVVVSMDNHIDYGTYVKIDHGNGYKTLSAHMIHQSATVSVGDYVYQGQVIGQVGSTGNSTGPHLHFELTYNGVKVDPYGWYQGPSGPYPNCNPEEYYWTSNPPIGPPNVSMERQLPDDLLIHVLGSPNYYWLQNGLMCGFDSEYPFYTWGLEWDDAVEITSEEFSSFSSGSNVEVMSGTGVFDQNGQRWVFDYASDTSSTIVKRKATNWEQLGYASDIWIPVSNDFMAQFNEGSELLSISDYPYGAVLQNENNFSERYVLVKGDDYGFNGQKIKLSLFSDDVYNINYYHHNFNVPVSNSVLVNYPSVSAQALVSDGKIITSGYGEEIYYVENGQKRNIVDETSFSYYGFNHANIHTVGNDLINVLPIGIDIFFSPSGGAGVYNGGELDDGSFDSGLESYWTFFDWQQTADFQVTNGDPILGFYKSEVNVYSGSNYYDVEVKQLVNVESDEMYHCSFYAKSDSPMMIKFNLGRDTSPWDNYGIWKEITTESDWRRYQYIFDCTEADDLARLTFQIGEIPGHLCLDHVMFEKVGEILSPANNLLANADFELGHYAPWQVEDHNGIAEYYTDSFETYDGECSMFIDPNQSGEDFQVQLKQLVDVQSGENYYISFYAKAEENRDMTLELCHNGSPWSNYGLWEEVNIGTNWALYNVQFTASNSGTPRFSMHFGDQDIGIWIDNVSISTEATSTDEIIVNQEDIFVFQNYPNPFNPETRIDYSVSDSDSELMIYNIKGQVVKNYNLSPSKRFVIWSGLNNSNKKVSTGVYLYAIKTGSQMTQMKKMILMK
jgi:Peptidase family M23/Carbohydrate binding domain/Secretion system C-terminal sorting domain